MKEQQFSNYPLDDDILRALQGLGFEQPTAVQNAVILPALAGRDLVVQAQTGSGKTAAFGIPICQKVQWEENKPQALILTPTRELAQQVKEDLSNIGRFKRIKVAALYGKSPFAQQQAELKQKNHVVAGTPGRILDHLERGTLSIDRLTCLVLDEVDKMAAMGFIEQVEAIVQRLPRERMTMVFSATLTPEVEKLCARHLQNPQHIEITTDESVAPLIEHSLYTVQEQGDKLSLLTAVAIRENPDSCLIFCRTHEAVDTLFEHLADLGYPCGKIHGGMLQTDRFAVMNDFRRGLFRYLVATDVAARGIDIENITHVIHYDLPLEKESYVHRTGRTGRAGRRGKAISFATARETRLLAELEQYIGYAIPRTEAPTEEEVQAGRAAFQAKLRETPQQKQDRGESLSRDILKVYFNGGKKKKLRAVDFVGTLCTIDGVSADDIGIITILDNVTYVEILNGKGQQVIAAMKTTSIKGKQLKVHEARK